MWRNWKGKRLKQQTRHAMGQALVRAGEATKSEVLKIVPHDEGTLQESVMVIQNPRNKLQVVLAAGGGPGTGFPPVPYALRHHEIQSNFQKGRKKNYVRDPITQFAPAAVTKELKKAGKQVW